MVFSAVTGYVIEEDEPGGKAGTSTGGIKLSGETVQNNSTATESISPEEMRQKRLEYLNRLENKSATQNCDKNTNNDSSEQSSASVPPTTTQSKTKTPVCTVTKDTSGDTPQESKENGKCSQIQ